MHSDPRKLAEEALAIHEGCDDPGCLQVDLSRALLSALDALEAANEVVQAAQKVRDLHSFVFDLPVLAEEHVEATAKAWAKLRAALDALVTGHGSAVLPDSASEPAGGGR